MCVVDTDWGCGIIQRGSQGEPYSYDGPIGEMTYEYLMEHQKELLDLITGDEFLNSTEW